MHGVLQKILGDKIPMNCKTLYMCNLDEGHIHIGDRYLVKIPLRIVISYIHNGEDDISYETTRGTG